jgi:hypothetical protein
MKAINIRDNPQTVEKAKQIRATPETIPLLKNNSAFLIG